VGIYDSPPLVGIKAVHLPLSAQKTRDMPHVHTNISPPCVPAKMYCEETASVRMDLSCLIRCESDGVRLTLDTGFSPAPVPTMLSLCRGAAVDIVSLAPECASGVPA
jgi:hypothetical protein